LGCELEGEVFQLSAAQSKWDACDVLTIKRLPCFESETGSPAQLLKCLDDFNHALRILMAIGFQGYPDDLLIGWRDISESHFGESQAGSLAVGDLEIIISELCHGRQNGFERCASLLIGMIVIKLPERHMEIDNARLKRLNPTDRQIPESGASINTESWFHTTH
jgi:hypothetical protein